MICLVTWIYFGVYWINTSRTGPSETKGTVKCCFSLNAKQNLTWRAKLILSYRYLHFGTICNAVKILTSSWYIFCNLFFFETFHALLRMPTSKNNTPTPGRGNHKNNIKGGYVLLVHQMLTLLLTKTCRPLFFQTHFQTVAHISKDRVIFQAWDQIFKSRPKK